MQVRCTEKRAALLSCLTGLRISDILALTWDNIMMAPDLGYCIRIRTIKTGTEALLPITLPSIASGTPMRPSR